MMNIFNLNFYFYYIIHLKLFDFKNWPDNFDGRLYNRYPPQKIAVPTVSYSGYTLCSVAVF